MRTCRSVQLGNCENRQLPSVKPPKEPPTARKLHKEPLTARELQPRMPLGSLLWPLGALCRPNPTLCLPPSLKGPQIAFSTQTLNLTNPFARTTRQPLAPKVDGQSCRFRAKSVARPVHSNPRDQPEAESPNSPNSPRKSLL